MSGEKKYYLANLPGWGLQRALRNRPSTLMS
jgi:hypothetical protein